MCPLRVMMRTPAASRRTIIRNPSCLISCSQPGPLGGFRTGDGKHGSILDAALISARPRRNSIN